MLTNLVDLVFWDSEAAGTSPSAAFLAARRTACPRQLLCRPNYVEPALLACDTKFDYFLGDIVQRKAQNRRLHFLPPLSYCVVPLTHYYLFTSIGKTVNTLVIAAESIYSKEEITDQLINSTDETFGITPLSLAYVLRKALHHGSHPLASYEFNPTIKCRAISNRCSLLIASQFGTLPDESSFLVPAWLKHSAPGAFPVDDLGQNLLMVAGLLVFPWVLNTLPIAYPSLACDLAARTLPSAGGNSVLHMALKGNQPSVLDALMRKTGLDWELLNTAGESPFGLALQSHLNGSLPSFLFRSPREEIRLRWNTSSFSKKYETLLSCALHSTNAYVTREMVDFVCCEANLEFLLIPINSRGELPLPFAIRELAMGRTTFEANFFLFVSRLVQRKHWPWILKALEDKFFDEAPIQFYCALIDQSIYSQIQSVCSNVNPESLRDSKGRNILQFVFSSMGAQQNRESTGGVLKTMRLIDSREELLAAVDSDNKSILHYLVERLRAISISPSLLNDITVDRETFASFLCSLAKFADAPDSSGMAPRQLYFQKIKEIPPLQTSVNWVASFHAELIKILGFSGKTPLEDGVVGMSFDLARCGLSAALGEAGLLSLENASAGLLMKRDPQSNKTLYETILFSPNGRRCVRQHMVGKLDKFVGECLNEGGVFETIVADASASFLKLACGARDSWKAGQLTCLLRRIQANSKHGTFKWSRLVRQIASKPEQLESLSESERAECLQICQTTVPILLLAPLQAILSAAE